MPTEIQFLSTAATNKQARQRLLSFATVDEAVVCREKTGKIRVGKEGKVVFSKHMSREERADRGFDMLPSNYSNRVRREVYTEGKGAVSKRFGKLPDDTPMDALRLEYSGKGARGGRGERRGNEREVRGDGGIMRKRQWDTEWLRGEGLVCVQGTEAHTKSL
jgi:hypothetical protein